MRERHPEDGRTLRWRLAAALVVALLLASCGSKSSDDDADDADSEANQAAPTDEGEAVSGGTLRVALPAEIDGVNPVDNRWSIEGNMIGSAIFDTLLTFDEERNLVPRLAESVTPNDDGTVWTIVLKPDITFQNDQVLDSVAVKMNIDGRRANPLSGGALAPIEEVVTVDALTAEVRMNTPWFGYDYTLAAQGGYMVAPDQIESGDAATTMAIGTGPFEMSSKFSPGEPIELVRNEDYWGDEAYLDGIEFSTIIDGTSRAAALESGTVDMILTEDPENIRDFRETDGIIQVEDVASEEAFVMLNHGVPPFDNEHARLAVAYATDTESLIETLGAQVWQATEGPYTPEEAYYAEESGYPGFDPAKAAEEMAAYEEETGQPLAVTIKSSQGILQEVSEAVAGQWREAGIDATAETAEQATFLLDTFTGNFESVIFRNFGYVSPDSNYIFWSSTQANGVGTGSINFGQLKSDEVDSILETARANPDDEERVEQYKGITPALNEALPYIWLWHVNWALAANEDVGGLTTAQELGFARQDAKPWWNQLWLTQ